MSTIDLFIFCRLCGVERSSDSFSTAERRRHRQNFEGDEYMCLKHTSTSSFDDRYNSEEEPLPIIYTSSESESETNSSDSDSEDDEEEGHHVHAKRTSYYTARSRYAILGEHWGAVYDRLIIKYAFYTKEEMMAILRANDRCCDALLALDRRDLYFNEFVDIIIDSHHDAQRCLDGSIRPIDTDSDSSTSDTSSSGYDEFNTLSQSETEEDAEEKEEEEFKPPSRQSKRFREDEDEVTLVHSHGMSTRSRSVISRLNNCELNLK